MTLQFNGQVTSINNPQGAVSSSLFSVGDPVHVNVSYDSKTKDDDPNVNSGMYWSPGLFTVNIGQRKFELISRSPASLRVSVIHGTSTGQEAFGIMANGGATAWPPELSRYGGRLLGLNIFETKPPHDLLSGTELPRSIDITRADYAMGYMSVLNGSGYGVQFQLLAIPEPRTIQLLALGVICVAWGCRRRGAGKIAPAEECFPRKL